MDYVLETNSLVKRYGTPRRSTAHDARPKGAIYGFGGATALARRRSSALSAACSRQAGQLFHLRPRVHQP